MDKDVVNEALTDIIVDGGLIDTILTALGLSSDVIVTNDYSFFYSLFAISLALIFVVYFIVLFFRSLASMLKSSRL